MTLGLAKKYLFPVTIRKKEGRQVGKIIGLLIVQKCVLCMFYVDWELEGQKKNLDRDFLSKNLLAVARNKQLSF